MLFLGTMVAAGLGWWSAWPISQPATAPEDTPSALVLQAPRLIDVELLGGGRVSIPEGSFNHNLSRWLAGTDGRTVSRRFIVDNLTFATDTTRLTPESTSTVNALVAILTAYPTAMIRLEGYTDGTGNMDANLKLSLDRANTVKALMVREGIAAARIATAGFGQEKPIAGNETERGRLKNRRLEAVVQARPGAGRIWYDMG